MFQNILVAEYHGTFSDSPYQRDSLYLLTFKTTLSGEKIMSAHKLGNMAPRTFPERNNPEFFFGIFHLIGEGERD
jgi:hypothetical protein